MVEVHARVDIAVSRERVWRVLMDFARYDSWHPYVRLAGNPVVGSDIGFEFRKNPAAPRGWKTVATVTQVEPLSCLAYIIGLRGVCTMEQWFSLEDCPEGTRVTHGAKIRGIFALIGANHIRKRLIPFHETPLEQLARGFDFSQKAKSPGAKSSARPRKGFRGYKR